MRLPRISAGLEFSALSSLTVLLSLLQISMPCPVRKDSIIASFTYSHEVGLRIRSFFSIQSYFHGYRTCKAQAVVKTEPTFCQSEALCIHRHLKPAVSTCNLQSKPFSLPFCYISGMSSTTVPTNVASIALQRPYDYRF